MTKISFLLLICLMQGGCFWGLFSNSITVKVKNHTDRTIHARPDTEDSTSYIPYSRESIGKGKSYTFYIDGVDYEPDIEVEYKGMIRYYNVNVDFWGYDTINVETYHFVNGNG